MVTIIGTGNMARGIGTRMLAGGESINLLGTDRTDAEELAGELRSGAAGGATVKAGTSGDPIQGDVVILAVPYPALSQIAKQYGDQLAGKILVDITNPLNATYDALATPPGTSAAEQLAGMLPRARVLKAFNTTFAGTLVAGQVAGQALDVFIAGDDSEAKETLSRLVGKGGLHPVDVGPLKRAQQLEQMGFLGISLQQPLGLGFGSGWKLLMPRS